MSDVNTGDDGGGKKGKHGKARAKKSSTRIDMTPMVDLAFLLLTFFMLTTTFSKPKTMELTMPFDKDKTKNEPVNNALTFLLTGDNKIYYYYGELKKDKTEIALTNFSKDGVHKILLDYNKWAVTQIQALEKQRDSKAIADTTFKRLAGKKKGDALALMALVKTDDKATYGNVIDMLDELNICYVGKYALVDLSPLELELMTNYKK